MITHSLETILAKISGNYRFSVTESTKVSYIQLLVGESHPDRGIHQSLVICLVSKLLVNSRAVCQCDMEGILVICMSKISRWCYYLTLLSVCILVVKISTLHSNKHACTETLTFFRVGARPIKY